MYFHNFFCFDESGTPKTPAGGNCFFMIPVKSPKSDIILKFLANDQETVTPRRGFEGPGSMTKHKNMEFAPPGTPKSINFVHIYTVFAQTSETNIIFMEIHEVS